MEVDDTNDSNKINFVIENQKAIEVSKDLLKMMMDPTNFEIGISVYFYNYIHNIL